MKRGKKPWPGVNDFEEVKGINDRKQLSEAGKNFIPQKK